MRAMLHQIRIWLLDEPVFRPYILTAVYLLFIGLFLGLHHRIDYIVNFYLGIPLIIATYYYGFGAGMLLMLLEALLHIVILSMMGDEYEMIYRSHRIRIAFISLVVLGYVVSMFRKARIELKLSENRYREISEELHKTNQAKDRFFSIIAHDLRGPIGAISANVDLLANEKEALTEQEKHDLIQALHAMSTRVFNLLENLLKWALVQRGNVHLHFEFLDVNFICQESIQLFQYIAHEKNIRIVNQVSAELMVWCDRNALEAVIRNLISNALKFSYPGSEIVVEGEKLHDVGVIRVTDHGIGMEDDLIKQIFTEETIVARDGTRVEKGTGLGLALSNDLMQKCGATLTVASVTGKGSTFSLELPLRPQELV